MIIIISDTIEMSFALPLPYCTVAPMESGFEKLWQFPVTDQ